MEDRAKIRPGLPRDRPILSYWQDPPSDIADHRTSPVLPTEADVVIIGSGISGSSIAYNLLSADPSTKVVLLEARQAASGASGRNGGHTKTASYRSFLSNLATVGKSEAVKIANLEYNTMVDVHAFAKEHNIPCDSLRCDTVDVFYDKIQWESAQEAVAKMYDLMGATAPRQEFHAAEKAARKFYSPNCYGALAYEAGSLSAYKFTIGVLKLALALGLDLQTGTPALKVTKDTKNNTWTVETPRGHITTPKLVLATNGYTAHLFPKLQGTVVPLRGVITAQRPGSKLPQKGLPWTYSFVYKDGYEYMISRPKGTKHEGDIVIGGGLTYGVNEGLNEFGNTDDTAYDEDCAAYLRKCTKTFFGPNWGQDHPDGQVRRTWSGVMGFSSDGHPFVGPVPGEDGLFLDVSFQGHGMVLAFLCARACAQMIRGEDGSKLDEWFPQSYRVTEARMQQRFLGKLTMSGAPEKESKARL